MDIPFAFVAGGVLGRRTRGTRPDISLVFVGLGLAPAGLYFLERWPAWDTHYLGGDHLPPWGGPAFMVAMLGAALLGHHRGRSNRAIGVGLLLVALGLFGSPARTLHVGTAAAWSAGKAPLLPWDFLLTLLLAAAWVAFWGVGCLVWAERTAWPPPVVAEEASHREARDRAAGLPEEDHRPTRMS